MSYWQIVGIKRNASDRDSPLDFVLNITGMNNVRKGFKPSAKFAEKVFGTPGQLETESPHTLPFISLEFYSRMLIHAGEYERAKSVKRYMNETGIA